MNVLKHHEEIYNQILSLIFLDEKKIIKIATKCCYIFYFYFS